MSIRRYTAINLAGSVVPILVLLVSIPLYLHLLGTARFGAMTILWAFLGYFAYFDLGLGKAVNHRIAKLSDQPPQARAAAVWSALALNVSLGIVSAVVLWFAGHYAILHVLRMSEPLRMESIGALPWMVAALPVLLLTSVLGGALEGRNQFLAVNTIQVAGSAGVQLVPLAVAVLVGPGLEYIVPAAVLSRAATAIPLLVLCQSRVMPGGRPTLSRSEMRALFGFGGWVALFGLAALGIESGDRFIVGAVLGAAATAIYVIPIQFAGRLRIVPAALSRALFPQLSTPGAVRTDAQRSLVPLVHIMTPVVILASLLLAPFFTLWLGGSIAVSAAPIGFVVLLGVWASALGYVPMVWLQASGRPHVVALLAAAELPMFLVALWFVSGRFGLVGAAIVWTIRAFVDVAFLLQFAGMLRRALRMLLVPAMLVATSTLCAFSMHLGGTFMPFGAVVGSSMFVASLWIGRTFWLHAFAWLRHRSVGGLRVLER